MTWMNTANGSKAHYQPINSNVHALCGVKADKYDSENPPHAEPHCKRCEKIKARAENGEHDEYDRFEVV